MLRCGICGRKLTVDRANDRLLVRCPKHGIVLRYYARPKSPPAARAAASRHHASAPLQGGSASRG